LFCVNGFTKLELVTNSEKVKKNNNNTAQVPQAQPTTIGVKVSKKIDI